MTQIEISYAYLLYRNYLQDNYNVIHISAMYSREDVVKLLLTKKGVDPYSTGGVSVPKYPKTGARLLRFHNYS